MDRADHHFSPELAVLCGVDAAIFLHNIYFWTKQNKANGKHFHDGHYWTYNKAAAFCEIFPYWTKRQIERIISKCKESELLLTGCYNEDPRDRTMWYSLTKQALAYFCDDVEEWFCESRNGEMQTRVSCHTNHETVTALPDNKPDNKQPPYNPPEGDVPPSEPKPKPKRERRRRAPKAVPEWKPERFEGFWAAYPRDEERAKAVEQWDKLRTGDDVKDDVLLHEIALGLKRHLECEDWVNGIGIPHAWRWLRDKRWTEKQKQPRPHALAPPGREEDDWDVI